MYILALLSVFMIILILNGLLLAVVFNYLQFMVDGVLFSIALIMATSITFLLHYYHLIS